MAGANRSINFQKQTKRKRHGQNIWQNAWSAFFMPLICFFLSVLKKTNTLHIDYVWQHKDIKEQLDWTQRDRAKVSED